MSATATSIVPSFTSSSHGPVIQSTRNIAPREVSTPKATEPSTYSPSPGKFRHPRTTEILLRSSATSLTNGNVKRALTNAAALILSFVFTDAYYSSITPLLNTIGVADASHLSSTVLSILRIILCANIILLLRPVIPYISKKDEIQDIPLTPSQRSLLGLNPSIQPTPNSAPSAAGYITPPRYRRSGSFSSTGSPSSAQNGFAPLSTDRRSISAHYSSSPLSTSRYTLGFSPTPSHSIRRTASGSPFSPSPSASPLFHKAAIPSSQIPDVDFSASTRSFGASTGAGPGLGRSQSMRERTRREGLEPTSPTPGTKSPQIVPGLNYKWLYDKGRKLPKSDSYGF
ncbi:uncharacterized protein Z518_00307 [Rhinocladiella mackenziei CBS 650.93]|uniref:Uncharacterized protein n=1 Tax=Rhinocladiella mackenziei CBS 650.93 TaxID=1442369 RepID=A0A0D2HEW9_9EURO|nr:uncharacterized protein Z518_00307 [Rhinocladiella mackenziei CBS 650.93]KIX09228.1 hypothetical protein Z518_00307 [Rhinocladiella mackenziei CBS 650.93]